MGKVEIFINEEGVLKIAYHNDLRVLLERLRPESLERPRAAGRGSCRSPEQGQEQGQEEEEQEDRFTRAMTICFLIAVTWAAISIIFYERILVLYMWRQTEWMRMVMLLILAPVVAVTVFALAVSFRPPPARRKEVPTISALVQEV